MCLSDGLGKVLVHIPDGLSVYLGLPPVIGEEPIDLPLHISCLCEHGGAIPVCVVGPLQLVQGVGVGSIELFLCHTQARPVISKPVMARYKTSSSP